MNVREFVNYCRKSRVVRVAFIYVPLAWFTLRAILIALPGLDAPGWVPKLFAVLLLIGYPVALIASWAMDIGDEERAEKSQSGAIHVPAGSAAAVKKQTSTTTFGALLLVGMAVLGSAIYFMLNPVLPTIIQPKDDIQSVAVLPFLNLSTDAEHQIFCDGLSEELLNLLTRVQSLKVAARTSSFAMRDSELDIPAIGKQLEVSHIVEGSVRRDGANLRVTAQLVRSSDGYHVWSENYDRKFTEIFEIQDDIATNIVARLVKSLNGKSTLDALPEVEQTQPDAYFAYLQGRGALTNPGRENLLQAADFFHDALEISPTYKPAMIGRVYTEAMIGLSAGQSMADRRQLFATALQLAEDMQYDAWAAAAAAVLGLSLYEWDLTRDVVELGLGAHLNDIGLAALHAELLLVQNRADEAMLEIRRIDAVTPDIAATEYLRALTSANESLPTLENLFVTAADARNWHPTHSSSSILDARRKLFRRCSASLTEADQEEPALADCEAIGAFIVPLLAMLDKDAAALERLLSMVETRTFDAVLTRLPAVSEILSEPGATAAIEILNLPDANEVLTIAGATR